MELAKEIEREVEAENEVVGSKGIAQDYIRRLKARYANYSSSQIAAKIGMGQSTFSRLENGQARPSLNSMSKLVAAVGDNCSLAEVVAKAKPEIASRLEGENLKMPIAGGEFAAYFKNRAYRDIMLLAISRSGTTKEEIQGEYGRTGLKHLEELLAKGILFDFRGIIKIKDIEVTFERDVLKDALIDSIQYKYDAEKLGTYSNWLTFQSESVDKEKAMAAINKVLVKAYKGIEEILYSSEYYGNDKIFVGMVADSLLKDSDREEV